LKENSDETDNYDEEEEFMDLEDKRMLNKRKKRSIKVDDCHLDLEKFIIVKK
jgi:hypothetical protein